jgi:hypothetical protein
VVEERQQLGGVVRRGDASGDVDAVGNFSLRAPVEADERRGGVLPVLALRSMRGWLQASTTPAAGRRLRDGEVQSSPASCAFLLHERQPGVAPG